MIKFKVGDWVTTKAGYTKQISCLTSDACDTLSIGNTSVGINVVFKNEIELWQPKEGEWCWFWNNGSQAFLGQYDGVATSSTSTWYMCKFVKHSNTISSIYDNIEPFFGELPSFLKDQK